MNYIQRTMHKNRVENIKKFEIPTLFLDFLFQI